MNLYDHDAERQYLGAVLADAAVLDRYPLGAEHMHERAHALVLDALYRVRERGEEPSLLAVRSELERAGRLREIGGEPGLLTVARSPEAPPEAVRDRLAELAEIRRVRESGLRIAARCESLDLEAALDEAHAIADAARTARQRRVLTATECVASAIEHLGLLSERASSRLIPTGLSRLDAVIGGLEAGDMLTIGAQTNVGKSWTALTAAYQCARQGVRAGIVSLEDPERLWGARLTTLLSGVSSNAMRRRKLDAADFRKIATAGEESRALPLHIAIATGATVHQVLETMRALVMDHGCEVVTVDYAQCLYGVDAKSEHSAMKRMVTMLKSAAERLGVPLVLLSQIKRGDNPDREPSKYDLKEGGDLEIKSEYVVMLWRDRPAKPDEPTPPLIRCKLDKSKVGGNGLTFSLRQQPSGQLVEVDERYDDFAPEPPASQLYSKPFGGRR